MPLMLQEMYPKVYLDFREISSENNQNLDIVELILEVELFTSL
jgi:hypothetical protein